VDRPLLEISNLHKAFGAVRACDGIDLEVMEGELLALIGPNGAGKTTLTKLITGEHQSDEGSIVLDGQEITRMRAHDRGLAGVARSYQITSVFPRFSALGNVTLAVQAQQGHSFRFVKRAKFDQTLRQPALEILEKVGLGARTGVVASELAHGEQRQLEIALALAMKPRLLLLDEPTAGMGWESTEKMVQLIRQLKGSTTIVLIEHDMDTIFALADRIAVLVYGQVLDCGEPEQVRKNPEVRQAYLGDDGGDDEGARERKVT
jgi:branched-chain amino acid transport system ATP-binding protein